MNKQRNLNTRKLVLLALLTAIVVVLQVLAVILPIYPFTLTLVLVPMVIGAALVGTAAGGWLGLVFGFAVLLSGNANVFLAVNAIGTVTVVLLKGIFAGLAAGAVYRLFAGKNKTVAAVAAAVICPVVNTGIFIIGSYVFFLSTLEEWGAAAGFADVTAFIFIGMIGLNFIIELAINLVLSPVIVRLIQYGQDRKVTIS